MIIFLHRRPLRSSWVYLFGCSRPTGTSEWSSRSHLWPQWEREVSMPSTWSFECKTAAFSKGEAYAQVEGKNCHACPGKETWVIPQSRRKALHLGFLDFFDLSILRWSRPGERVCVACDSFCRLKLGFWFSSPGLMRMKSIEGFLDIRSETQQEPTPPWRQAHTIQTAGFQ